ncbi:transposase [Paraphaeosphaeria sporulosa]
MSNLRYPVRIKYIPSLALILARQRSPTAKAPGKNWPRAFKKRHPELKARTVYNMDETGVMLSMLGSVKVLIAYPTPGWHYAHSKNGYNDSKISFKANILLCRLPSHTSYKTQPCDVTVFASLKAAYRDEVERLLRGGLDNIGKEHFTSLYKPVRDKAFSKRNITASWAATGLLPFNPERVLRSMPKPTPKLTISILNEEPPPQVEVLKTPITLVTIEGLASLHTLIQRDAHALPDELSKHHLQRHV